MKYGDEGGIYKGGSPVDPRWVPVPEKDLDGLREVARYLRERGMESFAERVQEVVSNALQSTAMATVLLENDVETTKVWWGSQNGSLYGAKGECRALIIDSVSHLTRAERGAKAYGK